MQANLELLSGAHKGQRRDLTRLPFVVGRSPESGLQLHPTLDEQASTRHAQFELENGAYWIVDLNSSNGTYVNGQRVTRQAVKAGDIITFGKGGPAARFGLLNMPTTSTPVATPGLLSTPRPVAPPVPAPTSRAPGDDRPPVTLIVTASGQTRTFNFNGEVVRIGRHPTNDITFDPNAETVVSANHAKLAYMAGAWTLVDLDSRNGVWLRGAATEASKVTRLALRGGEEFELGRGGPRVRFEVAGVPRRQAALTVQLDEQNTLAIANRTQRPVLQVPLAPRLTIGRDPACAVPIPDPQVSWEHAIVTGAGGVFTLEDRNSRNGTWVNGKRIRKATLAGGDTFVIGGRRILFRPPELVLHDFATGAGLECMGLQRVSSGRQLLDDIWLSIGTGEFAALLGPSGGGKSTLMKALNGYRPADQGTVRVAQSDLYSNAEAARSFIGYVPQDDAVHMHLTVRATLQFVARLRLPPDFSRAEREARVDTVLSQLELLDHQKKYVYQLSGGQRKRVSIGVELLTDPKVLFLDEPTSGLDPGMEYNMMRIGRELAAMGRTVIMTTHAMTNIELCDRLVFLVQGKLAYFGPPRGALSYFKADRYEELFEVYKDKKPEEWKAYYKTTAECRQLLPAYASPQPPPPALAPAVAKRPSFFDSARQTLILFERYCMLNFADPWNLFMLLVATPGIIGLGFIGLYDSWMQLLMLALTSYWLACQNASKEVVKELVIYKRERMVNLGLVPYIFSKLTLLTVIAWVQSLVLLFMVVSIHGHTQWNFAGMYWVLVCTALAGVSMGLLISAGARTLDQAQTAVPILLICQVIFSGAFQSQDGWKPWSLEAFVVPGISSYWSFDQLKRVAAQAPDTKTRASVDEEIDRIQKADEAYKSKYDKLDEERQRYESELERLVRQPVTRETYREQLRCQGKLQEIASNMAAAGRSRDELGKKLKSQLEARSRALWFNYRGNPATNVPWVQSLTFLSLVACLVVLKLHDYREII